jgi:hypothetical protein
LGTVGWYRKFIPHFTTLARPLYNLLKKDVPWEWTEECEQSFKQLRNALTTQPVLHVADPNRDYILRTDASDHGLGAFLMQKDDNGDTRLIACASRSLTPAEKKWSVTEREALAIPWALTHFNTYVEGHKYTCITDHAALRYLYNNKTPRLYRLVSKLSPYELTIEYQPGKENHGPDLLSREHQLMEMKEEAVESNVMPTRSGRQQ